MDSLSPYSRSMSPYGKCVGGSERWDNLYINISPEKGGCAVARHINLTFTRKILVGFYFSRQAFS